VKRLPVWLGLVALLVLVARWLAYALAPTTTLSGQLKGSVGGPSLVIVTLVSLGLAVLVATLTVWFAAIGVRERQRLRPQRIAPELRLRRLALRAVVLYASSSLAFAMFESYLHWRAGIGFHGLSCLVGPVHRNAIPLLAALSLAAAALWEAAEHVLGWMRAVVRELLRRRLAASSATFAPPFHPLLVSFAAAMRPRSRGPPLPA
jgi:hypothetical protein